MCIICVFLCDYVHRLKLQNSFKFWVAVATYIPRLSLIPVFLILYMYMPEIKCRPYFFLTGKCATRFVLELTQF